MNVSDISVVPLKARIPVTPNMYVVLVIGGIIAIVLAKLPGRFAWLSRLAVILTIITTAAVGFNDLNGGNGTGGVLSNTQTSSKCAGWDEYVDVYSRVHEGHEGVLIAWNEENLSPSEIEGLVTRVSTLTNQLTEATTPPAAAKIHKQLLSILQETDKQLRLYADGDDSNPKRLSRLQDGMGGLVDNANDVCA